MDCCKPNASSMRKALILKFLQFLYESEEESEISSQEGGRISSAFESQNLQYTTDDADSEDSSTISSEISTVAGKHGPSKKCPAHASEGTPEESEIDFTVEDKAWGPCRLPDHEILRQVKERCQAEGLAQYRKKKDELYRMRKADRNMALRPRGPPPENMQHRAGLPCAQCERELAYCVTRLN